MAWNGVHDRGGGRVAAGDELTVAAYAGRFLPRSDAGAEREDLHVEAEADHPAAVEQPECPGAFPGAGDVGWGGLEVPRIFLLIWSPMSDLPLRATMSAKLAPFGTVIGAYAWPA